MHFQEVSWPPYKQSRNISSLDTVWLPSVDSFEGDSAIKGQQDGRNLVYSPNYRRDRGTTDASGRAIARVLRALRRFISRSPEEMHREEHEPDVGRPIYKNASRIPPGEWQAFAAYSRPTVNGVDVHNTFTPSPTPYRDVDLDEVDLDEVFASLRTPGGIHPERWIRGIEHPSLPPPPTGWTLPGPGEPLPFPWECQLNPFLEHAVCGPAPVYWDIRSGGLTILYGGPVDVAVPLSAADLAQPASHPLLTHMFISGLALTDARFPWKFMVVNTTGIRVRDVFTAIIENFKHFVFLKEYERWSSTRQKRAELEWRLRGGELTQDGLRRIDYLCGQLFFRGLAPNPDRTGWVLYVGAEW